MSALYEYLRRKNSTGLPYDEAVQLFLWMYCSRDIMPSTFRTQPIGKETLIDTFQRLSDDGLIIEESTKDMEQTPRRIPWADLIDELLSERVKLDRDFPTRSERYL